MNEQLHEDLVALADRARVQPLDISCLQRQARRRVRRRQLGAVAAALLVAAPIGIGTWQATASRDRTQVLAADPASPGPVTGPGGSLVPGTLPNEAATPEPAGAPAAADCQSAAMALDQTVPATVVSSVVTDSARLSAWNASGRGGLGLPSIVVDPGQERNALGGTGAAGATAPVLFCWLEGLFPVPAGPAGTFAFAAFIVPATGQPQLLVASNARQATLVMPEAVTTAVRPDEGASTPLDTSTQRQDEVGSQPGPGRRQAPPVPVPCPTYAPNPTDANGTFCGPDPGPGNGDGPDGICTGQEAAPPCGPGMVPGTFYEYSLPPGCSMFLDGRPWYSGLPLGNVTNMWVYLTDDRFQQSPTDEIARVVGPTGAISLIPGTAPACPAR